MSEFDLIHSNSVLEHVGDWSKMMRFAKNITSFHGGYFVQTPNFWFPIEPHAMTPVIHWLPKPLRVWLVSLRSLGCWPRGKTVSESVTIVESARLLSRSMVKELFADSVIHAERVAGLTKSFYAVRDRSSNNTHLASGE